MSKWPPLLIIDVDGVCGDFNRAFLRLLNGITGRTGVFPKGEPGVWDWPEQELGFTSEEVSRAWQTIDNEAGYFWEHDVAPMVGAGHALRKLATLDHIGDAEVYFVTARRTGCARRRTAAWLKQAGYVGDPAVICTGLKGQLIKALARKDQRVVIVDDKPENLVECSRANIKYLVDHLYNRTVSATGSIRVPSLMLALENEFPRQAGEGQVAA